MIQDSTAAIPESPIGDKDVSTPILLVAHAPPDSLKNDRCKVKLSVRVGRLDVCDLAIHDVTLSGEHFYIKREADHCVIGDLGSKNGTFVNGSRIHSGAAVKLPDKSVIRAGGVVMVFHRDSADVADSEDRETHGMVGPFHAPKLARELGECAKSSNNILIAGPSGTGKDLAAAALRQMTENPVTVQDAALLSSGETHLNDEGMKFVFTSGAPAPAYGLEHDLLARLRIVKIPPLKERIADIPAIFDHALIESLELIGKDGRNLMGSIRSVHYEQLMLDGFDKNNVRGLEDLADRITAKAASGTTFEKAVDEVFKEHFEERYDPTAKVRLRTGQIEKTCPSTPPGSEQIEAAYKEHGADVSAIQRKLKEKSLNFSRGMISRILEQLKLPREKKKP